MGGLLGLLDTFYYHIYKAKLYKMQVAFWEQLTHVLRILFYAAFFVLVGVKATGSWWLIYPMVISLELVNTTTDIFLEPYTRRTLGGIPPNEYALHCLILLTQGAALSSLLTASWSYRAESDGIVWAPLDLGALSFLPMTLVCVAVALSFFEGGGFVRMAIERVSRPRVALT